MPTITYNDSLSPVFGLVDRSRLAIEGALRIASQTASSSRSSRSISSAAFSVNTTFRRSTRRLISTRTSTSIHPHHRRRREAAERLHAADAVPGILGAGLLADAFVALHET